MSSPVVFLTTTIRESFHLAVVASHLLRLSLELSIRSLSRTVTIQHPPKWPDRRYVHEPDREEQELQHRSLTSSPLHDRRSLDLHVVVEHRQDLVVAVALESALLKFLRLFTLACLLPNRVV